MSSPRRDLMVAWIIALVAVDLASKFWAVNTLDDGPVELPGPIDLQLGYNSGTAFGLFSNVPTLLIVVATGAIAVALIRAWWRCRTPTGPVALIIAGAVANAIDRLEAGSVVDMLHTGWWPTFNIADIYITTGVAWWAIISMRSERQTPSNVEPTDPARSTT
jgi:signal peptidase II